jgi:formate hydrogenlyase subunit 3/multisubunit Na+/H+ antiporter MnhD subunit
VSALVAVAIALIGAGLVVAARARPSLATAIGIAFLALSVIAAIAMTPGQTLAVPAPDAAPVGGIAITRYARLLIGCAAGAGTLLAVAGALARRSAAGPAAALFALAGVTLSLVATDPLTAAWAIVAASGAALAAGLLLRRTPDAVLRIVGDALRAIVAAAALGVVGIAWAGAAMGGQEPDPTIGGVAYGAVAAALVIRTAAVPAHGWAARLADAIPLPTTAPLLGWLPVAWTVVTLAWIDATISPLATELPLERALVLAVALATMALAPLAAWIQEDLGHAMAYLVVAGMGVGLLAPSALDPAAWAPGRTWLAIELVSATALIGIAVALEGAYGTRHIPDLAGWARRSPGLALGVVGVAIAVVGLPGMTVWTVRADLVDASASGVVGLVGRVLLIAPLLPLGRLLLVGLRPAGPVVVSGTSERPRTAPAWSERDPAAPMTPRSLAGAVVGTADVNRGPLASLAVLGLVVLSIAIALGGLGLPAAAAGGPAALHVQSAPSGDQTDGS